MPSDRPLSSRPPRDQLAELLRGLRASLERYRALGDTKKAAQLEILIHDLEVMLEDLPKP